VEADFTREIRRIRGGRALARLTQAGVGHYCGQVNLGATGPWHMTVRMRAPRAGVRRFSWRQ
jgi:hypothetical protein